MNTRSKIAVTLVLMVMLSGVANAAPVVTVSLLGRLTGSGNPFSSTVMVTTAGQSFDYQMVVQMAPIGTTNTKGTSTRTITSLTAGTDGMNSTHHDIVQFSSSTGVQANLNQALTFINGWGDGTGDQAGTPTMRSGANNDLLDIRPIQNPGVFTGITQQIMGSAVMQIASMGDGTPAVITPRWLQGGSGGIKINGSLALLASNTTENGPDPFIGYKPLTLLPEPASFSILGFSLIGLTVRRRSVA